MRPVLAIGYPDEMQARELMIAEFKKLGSKAEFCKQTGLSRRYLNLIMEWKRTAAHDKILKYFNLEAVYAMAEDLDGLRQRRSAGGRKRKYIVTLKERHETTVWAWSRPDAINTASQNVSGDPVWRKVTARLARPQESKPST